MLHTILTIYALCGMLTAIRTGWIAGINVAIAEAQQGIRNPGLTATVNTFNFLWDFLAWPALWSAAISKRMAKRAIDESQVSPAQLRPRG